MGAEEPSFKSKVIQFKGAYIRHQTGNRYDEHAKDNDMNYIFSSISVPNICVPCVINQICGVSILTRDPIYHALPLPRATMAS